LTINACKKFKLAHEPLIAQQSSHRGL